MKHISVPDAARLWRAAEGHNVNEAVKLRAQRTFAEAMSDSDLLTQLQPSIKRTLIARREAIRNTSEAWTTRATVDKINRDVEFDWFGFNDDNVARENMGDEYLPGTLPTVKNRQDYQEISMQATGLFHRADTVGLAFSVDWESIVNSRGGKINLITEGINELARHSRNHEDAIPVRNLITKNGINKAKLGPALTNAGTGVLGHEIPGNPAPSAMDILKFQAALAQMNAFQIDGVDIVIDKVVLVTAKANVPIFKQILANRTLTFVPARTGATSTSVSTQVTQAIDLGQDIEVVENRWLSAINRQIGGQAFFLIPILAERPGITRTYLEGLENPQFFIRDTNSKLVGGGEVGYEQGDYDTESVYTKVRWAFGSSVLWNAGILYSDGTGVASSS